MTLAVTFTDLQAEVARALGWDRTPGNWSANQDLDFTLAVDSGYRKFLSGEMPGERKNHDWSFLYPSADLELGASYSTGTITTVAADATVTLAVGTWPDWASQGELWYTPAAAGSEVLRVEVLSGPTGAEIELARNIVTAEVITAGTYTLRRVHYELPSDFGGMNSDSFTYRRDEQWHLPNIKVVGEADIRRVDRENNGDVYPRYASITPVSPTTTAVSQWRVRFYPLAEQTYQVEYRYKVAPPKLTDANTIPYGGPYVAEALVAAVVDSAVQKVHDSNDKHEQFLSCMRQAIFHDRRNFSPATLGQGVTDARRRHDSLAGFRRNTPVSNITTSF